MNKPAIVYIKHNPLSYLLNIVCAVCFSLIIAISIKSVNGIENKDFSKQIFKKCSSKPELNLMTTELDLRRVNATYSPENGEIIVPGRTNLTLECLSSKPIDFDFEGYLAHTLYSVETSRIFHKQSTEQCYSIIVKFETNREATGTYRCWNINEKDTANSSIYIYASGGSPPYLLFGDSGKEINDISVDSNEDFAILPCVTTSKHQSVALYQIEREGFKLLSMGDHLFFDPKKGFIFNLKKFPDPFTKYKCVSNFAKQSINSDVIFQLKQLEPAAKLKLNSTEIFEDNVSQNSLSSQATIICSGSSSLHMTSTTNCQTAIQCRLAEKCMKGETACSQPCRCSVRGHTCTKLMKRKLFNSEKFLGDKCETVLKNENGGLVHCSSSKYDEGVSLIYFVGLRGKTVHNWENAPVEDILNVSTTLGGNDDTYYVGEDVSFTCIGSKYVFSSGFQWKIILQNGSMISANESAIRSHTRVSTIEEEVQIKISLPEIHSILCMAPVWNQETWVNSSLRLSIQDTIAPSFIDPENITVSFYPNDKNKTLVCESRGYPQPDIMWLKGGEPLVSDFHFDNSVENLTRATLVFKEILEIDHGTLFTCNASNPRGRAFKTFSIYVRAHPSTLIYPLVGVGLLICFGIVLLVSIILLKRMQRKKASGYIFHFTDFDMDEFKNGNPEAVKKYSNVCEKALYLPYDDTLYEINEENLSIDFDNMLGQGEFGIVLQGKLKTRNDSTIPVAVKTLKGSDMTHLKSLLTELKIMIFIGQHRNVVELIGACTRHLSERQAYVVVEYCALGSLEEYLRQHRTTFLDEFQMDESTVTNCSSTTPYVQIQYLLKTSDLIKWGYETATGMEFLASKKVIHGDLALRNILLDCNQNIKITDFGLSKQLYKCTSNYVTRKKDVPLPWRWLAPETLQDHNFSTQSDVWAYGVILWELFSLAEVPYPGVCFNVEFLRQLGNGYRLDRPRYCNTEIYSIMRECWRQEAAQRPCFSTLRREFAEMLPRGSLEYDSDSEIVSQNNTNHLKEDYLLDEHQPLRV